MAVMCHGPHFRIVFRQDENDPEIHLKIVLTRIHNQNYFGPLPSLPWPLGHVRLISFLGLVCAALLFFSTC